MGFRRGMGATMPCRFNNGYIEVGYPRIVRYKTTVNINTDWQTNTFDNPVVCFVLWADNLLWVGNDTGEIVIMDKFGLLQALHEWEAPSSTMLVNVGYYVDNFKVREAIVDIEQPRVIMFKGVWKSYIANEDLDFVYLDLDEGSSDIRFSVAFKEAMENPYGGFGLVLNGGRKFDEKRDGYWEVDAVAAINDAIQLR